jgi:predicted metalloprotease
MSFNDNAQLDTSSIGTGGGGGSGRGGLVVGGGIGGLILAIIMMLLGINPGDVGGSTTPADTNAQSVQSNQIKEQCKTGADANKYVECRIVGTVNSAESFWSQELPKFGKQFREPGTIIYNGATQSACGTASNQVGPFYCPLDEKIYIDASFFQILTEQVRLQQWRAGAGVCRGARVRPPHPERPRPARPGAAGPAGRPTSGCRPDRADGRLLWRDVGAACLDRPRTQQRQHLHQAVERVQDIRDALSAARSVGDDSIQEKTQGRVTPENWTHGSSEARQRWFIQGMKASTTSTSATPSASTTPTPRRSTSSDESPPRSHRRSRSPHVVDRAFGSRRLRGDGVAVRQGDPHGACRA